MSLDEDLSRFIGRLYEAVYDDDAWHAVTYELMTRTGSRMAFISCADVRQREFAKANFLSQEDTGFARGAEEYWAGMYRSDPSLIFASEHPSAGVCDTSKLMLDDEFGRLDYVRWQQDRMGTRHWRVFYTQPVDDVSFALSLHPPANDGPTSREAGQLHRLLFDHMARALRLAARPPDLAGSSEVVIILDTAGQVLTMSPRAERLTCSGDGLRIEHRRLSGETFAITAQLNTAIQSAVTSGSLGGTGGGVRLTRASGAPDWLALVSPCPAHLNHLPVRTPAAIIRLVESQSAATLSEAHRLLFDLSPREMEVAQALLRGHSVESLCSELRISRNTAKAHLQSLFRKTDTNRQSELVHLLAKVSRD